MAFTLPANCSFQIHVCFVAGALAALLSSRAWTFRLRQASAVSLRIGASSGVVMKKTLSTSAPIDRLDEDVQCLDRPPLNPCNMLWMKAIEAAAAER